MDCGCGGSTYGGALNAEHQPAQSDPYYWTGKVPDSEPDKAEKPPATKAADKK